MSQRPAPRLDLMPSAADRWMECSASPRFCLENADLIPADLSSKFSQEGNTAHEVAAAFLQDREPDPKNCPTPIDAAMRMHGFDYSEYVLGLRSHTDRGLSRMIVEYKQPLWYYEGRNAVVDAAVINPESLHTVDYKYGAGVAVSPVENRQGIIYTYQIGKPLNLPPDFPVTIHIYQPRNRESDSPVKTWETNWDEIKTRAEEIADHAQVIQINNKVKGAWLDFSPSEKACRWCPAKAFCPAREKSMLDGLEPIVVADPPQKLPAPQAITEEQLARILKHKTEITKWLKEAEEYAESRLAEGHRIPGLKLVLSRGGNRYWSDEKKATELLLKTILTREEVIEESVISVAGAEKLLGKKKFSTELTALIARPEGKPTLAPADDPRDECVIRAENEFTALTDEQIDRLDNY